MKISIITINYNNYLGLKKTMQSVFDQSWKDYEYIIIDGGSTDGSKELIELNSNKINTWLCEPDNGIYQAMNKGIELAKGDYLLFLNSGDKLFDNDILNQIKDNSAEFDILYGDLMFSDNLRIRKYNDEVNLKYFMSNSLGHPSTLFKRDIFKKNKYNEEFKIVSDWILLFEIFLDGGTFKYLNIVISEFEGGGISDNEDLVNVERKNYINQKFPIIGAEFIKVQYELDNLAAKFNKCTIKNKIRSLFQN